MFQPQPAPFSGPAIRSLQPRSALKILVTSRKGGVGKSTISANLAAYFKAELGLTTTLLDLDLHGSSSDWLRAARPIGVVVQHHPLPLDLGRRGAALDARRHLRHAAESSDVVVADLTWSDALDGNWLFDYDVVLTPVSMSGIEVAATIGFLSNLHWVFESTVRTPPQLIICPSRVEATDSIREIFTSQSFPISFALSPPVLALAQAKHLFKKGYLSEMPGDAGESFKLFAQSVADVGHAHMRGKLERGRKANITEQRSVSGESQVLNKFMQQRSLTAKSQHYTMAQGSAGVGSAAVTPAVAQAAAAPAKTSLFKRLFRVSSNSVGAHPRANASAGSK